MARKRKRVPDVLWRLFGDRARPLADAIVSLIPLPDAAAGGCFCNRRCCLYCSGSKAMSYLVRPGDPADYRNLLTKCFVVFSENAPPVPELYLYPRCSQREIVRRSIEKILVREPSSSNLICCNYDKYNGTNSVFAQLTSPEWAVLLKRVGAVLMTYLLIYTSLFLPLPQKNYHQISGFPISDMNLKDIGYVPVYTMQHHAVCHGPRKRKRAKAFQPLPGEQVGLYPSDSEASSVSPTFVSCNGSENISTEDLSSKKCEESSEMKKMLTKKHARQYRWQRKRKCRSVGVQDNSALISCTDTCSSHSGCPEHQHDIFPISNQSEKKESAPCFCCSVFHDLDRISRNSEIDRRSIFYHSERSTMMLPRSHILYTLKSNASGASHLFRNIFGTFIDSITMETCSHSCSRHLTGHHCLYHSLMKLFKCLIRRARNCPYLRLLNRHCRDESSYQNTRTGASIGFKENSSVNLRSTGSEASHFKGQLLGSRVGNNPELISKVPVDRAELHEHCCPKKQVVSFVWAICRRVVPLPLLGGVSNWRILTKNISKFIKLRKFETFSLKECIHQLKISKFQLFSNCRNNIQFCSEFGNSDIARHAIMERWIFWLFSHLVLPLIQANFYVTDSEDEKLNALYYKKCIWEKLINEAECMKGDRFYKLNHTSARKILQNRMFGFSRVRIFPKRVGFRMLANLKAPSRLPLSPSPKIFTLRKPQRTKFGSHRVKYQYFKPVNKVLRDIHVVLKGLSRTGSFKMDSSVFNYNGAYRKLVPFLLLLRERSDILPSSFIVVSDVSKAFDSINHGKLLRVMEDVISEDEFVVEELTKVVYSKKCLKVQPFKILAHQDVASASGKLPLMPNSQPLNGIFVKKHTNRTMRKAEIIFNLKEHITRNLVLFRNNLYMQRVGIPQGSIVSPLLCSFYYEHMERNLFFPLLKKAGEYLSEECDIHDASTEEGTGKGGSKYLLLRFIDDFLFISNSKKQASLFFTRLERGVRDYNCYTNVLKLGLNFDMENREVCQSNRVHVGKDGVSFLRWSGLLVNCKTLEIQADYSRYLTTHLSSSLTVRCQGNVREQLTRKLQAFLQQKCHPIFYDSNINSSPVVRLNIYQAFLICAMKFMCYISHLSGLPKLKPQLCMNAIEASLRHMVKKIRRKMYSFGEAGFRPKYDVKRREITWLGLYAFWRVIMRKQTGHKELLGFLKHRLEGYGKVDNMPGELKYAVEDSHSCVLWRIKH